MQPSSGYSCVPSVPMPHDGYVSQPRMYDARKDASSLAVRRKSSVRTWGWHIRNDVSEGSASYDGRAIPCTGSCVTGNCGRLNSVSHSKDTRMPLPLYGRRWLYTRRRASYRPIWYARNGISHSRLFLSGQLLVYVQISSYLCAVQMGVFSDLGSHTKIRKIMHICNFVLLINVLIIR